MLSNGREPYIYSTDFKDLINAPKDLIEETWRKPFKLVDAHDITDEDIRAHKWFGILAFFMGHVYKREFLPFLKQAMQILKEIETENGGDYVVTLLNYILTTAETGSIEGFVETVKEGLSADTGEKIMTIAEQLMERGEQRGIQKGALLGERTLLKRQLAKRFGSVSSDYLEKIENADADSLLQFGDKIIEAKNLDDVFKNYH